MLAPTVRGASGSLVLRIFVPSTVGSTQFPVGALFKDAPWRLAGLTPLCLYVNAEIPVGGGDRPRR